MANSDSTRTRQQLIRRAFRRIGIDSPATDDEANGAELLNDIVAELDPQGRWLWAISNTESTLTLTPGQRAYTAAATPAAGNIQPYIQALETVVLLIGTSRVPCRVIDKTEATRSVELETTTGQPYLAHLEIAADPVNQRLIFLPTPNSAYTVHYTYQRMLYDFDSASDTPDFRRSMRLGLVKILANELAPEYGAVSDALAQRIMLEAGEAKKMLRAHNIERVDRTSARAIYF